MKATVDPELCTACGLCEEACPEVFEAQDDGIARAKVNPVPPEFEQACQDAADECPVEAITIE